LAYNRRIMSRAVFAVLLALVLAGCIVSGCAATSPATPTPLVVSATDLGVIGQPTSVLVRDGGLSGLLGQQVLWLFGDTILTTPNAQGSRSQSNSAGLAAPATPLQLSQPLDASGAPLAFLPFSSEEAAFNQAAASRQERIALWPGNVIAITANQSISVYQKLIVRAGLLNYQFVGIGLANIEAGQTSASRVPGLLFNASEPNFSWLLRVGDDLYLYGRLPPETSADAATTGVALARVALAERQTRAAYRFWDGRTWNSDVNQARPVMAAAPSLSVSYNAHLGRYLAFQHGAFEQQVYLRTAPQPQGPWSEPVMAFTGLAPAAKTWNYAAFEHPELATAGGQAVFVSYYHAQGVFKGELRLVKLQLR
jgi:hypothetical protein